MPVIIYIMEKPFNTILQTTNARKIKFAPLFLIIIIFLFCQEVRADSIILPKSSDGSCYKPNLSGVKPGDTLFLSGNYKILNLALPAASEDKPIIITSLGKVKIGGYQIYSVVLKGAYFKFISPKLGDIEITNLNNIVAYSGIDLEDSYGAEINGIEINNVAIGIKQNKRFDSDIRDNKIINCHISHTTNEGVYLGITNNFSSQGKFRNFIIKNNIIESTGWDGIQCGQGDFIIKGNLVKRWGIKKEPVQRAGIVIGNEATSVIENNILENGYGIAYQNFGTGKNVFRKNVIKNVDLSSLELEDLMYINARGSNFSLIFQENQFINILTKKKMINNATPADKTNGISYACNTGLHENQCNFNKKDKWNACSQKKQK